MPEEDISSGIFNKMKVKTKVNIHFKVGKKLYKSIKMNKNHLFIKNYEYFFKKVLTKG